VIKYKRADCLSILVRFEKKQRIRKFIFKTYDLSLNQYVLKGFVTVFSLGSLICEFQIFLDFVISGRVLYHVICPDLLRSYVNSENPNFSKNSAKDILDRGCNEFVQKPFNINDLSRENKGNSGEEIGRVIFIMRGHIW